jgi:hypothetical protein
VTSRLFGVGLSGSSLLSRERRVLERHPPRAVILFRRNIESVGQTQSLTAELARLAGSPWLCVDEEGVQRPAGEGLRERARAGQGEPDRDAGSNGGHAAPPSRLSENSAAPGRAPSLTYVNARRPSRSTVS